MPSSAILGHPADLQLGGEPDLQLRGCLWDRPTGALEVSGFSASSMAHLGRLLAAVTPPHTELATLALDGCQLSITAAPSRLPPALAHLTALHLRCCGAGAAGMDAALQGLLAGCSGLRLRRMAVRSCSLIDLPAVECLPGGQEGAWTHRPQCAGLNDSCMVLTLSPGIAHPIPPASPGPHAPNVTLLCMPVFTRAASQHASHVLCLGIACQTRPPNLAAGLEALELSSNHLLCLPPALAAATNLTSLCLDHNRMELAPEDSQPWGPLVRLWRLSHLSLAGNRLRHLPPGAFLPALTYLDLDSNRGLEAPPPSLSAATSLRCLALSGPLDRPRPVLSVADVHSLLPHLLALEDLHIGKLARLAGLAAACASPGLRIWDAGGARRHLRGARLKALVLGDNHAGAHPQQLYARMPRAAPFGCHMPSSPTRLGLPACLPARRCLAAQARAPHLTSPALRPLCTAALIGLASMSKSAASSHCSALHARRQEHDAGNPAAGAGLEGRGL